MNRIAVIGNGGGGKTTLSRRLRDLHQLPLTHVDSIQFIAGMHTRPVEQTRQILSDVANSEKWIIDGFGSLDVMETRFLMADRIVFVDFPLWRHYWWCTKRQFESLRRPRTELPEKCNEATLGYTFKLYKILWRVNFEIRPRLLDIFSRPEVRKRLIRVRNLREWNAVFENGLE